jgi:hypothetical protein
MKRHKSHRGLLGVRLCQDITPTLTFGGKSRPNVATPFWLCTNPAALNLPIDHFFDRFGNLGRLNNR